MIVAENTTASDSRQAPADVWAAIEPGLRELYQRFAGRADEAEVALLQRGFERIEAWWEEMFRRLIRIDLVLLSEAPQFWPDERYVYNPASPPTAFLWHKAAHAALVALGSPMADRSPIASGQYLADALVECGVLVLDVFPFAFHRDFTKLRYGSAALYKAALRATATANLSPKLVRVRNKAHAGTRVVFRYDRVRDAVGNLLQPLIESAGLAPRGEIPVSVSGGNMSMSVEKFVGELRVARASRQMQSPGK